MDIYLSLFANQASRTRSCETEGVLGVLGFMRIVQQASLHNDWQ